MLKKSTFNILGALIVALSISFLGMPNDIADGGLVGIALLLHYAFSFSPAAVNFFGFLIIFAISYKFLDKPVLLKSFMTVILLSFFTFLFETYGQPLGGPLVGAVFYGFFMGIGFALILLSGSSIGGASTLALVFKKQFGWNVVLTTFILDVLVVFSGIFIIGVLNTLYSIIGLFVGKVTADYVLAGFDAKKAFNIVSPHHEEISRRITTELSLSATYLNGSGVYQKKEQRMLYIVVRNHSVVHLRRIINEVDSNAFVVVNNVKDVSGGTLFAGEHLEKKQPEKEISS